MSAKLGPDIRRAAASWPASEDGEESDCERGSLGSTSPRGRNRETGQTPRSLDCGSDFIIFNKSMTTETICPIQCKVRGAEWAI
jgi:hypothetical protein